MRYLWLLSPLLLSGCYYPYYPYYGYWGNPYPSAYPYGYSPGYYGASPPPYAGQRTAAPPQQYEFGSAQPGYGGPITLDPHNCGTPDEPMSCAR